jgi:hypothetical protein
MELRVAVSKEIVNFFAQKAGFFSVFGFQKFIFFA